MSDLHSKQTPEKDTARELLDQILAETACLPHKTIPQLLDFIYEQSGDAKVTVGIALAYLEQRLEDDNKRRLTREVELVNQVGRTHQAIDELRGDVLELSSAVDAIEQKLGIDPDLT